MPFPELPGNEAPDCVRWTAYKKTQTSSTLNTLLNKDIWKVDHKSFTAKDCLLPTLCCSKHQSTPQKMAYRPQIQHIYHGDGYHFHVKEYIERHTNGVDEVVQFQGGWEQWLQIEVARAIKAEWHQPVLCEPCLWTTARINLWAKGAQGLPNTGIELTCRSNQEESDAFGDRFVDSLKKIAKRQANRFTPCILYAIGIGRYEDVERYYAHVPDPNREYPIPLYHDEEMQGRFLIFGQVEHA